MNTQKELDYNRIAQVIHYVNANFQKQPSLEELAALVHLSPFHFQRLFKQWAGTTPKKFLQYISLNHAKSMLRDRQATLFDTSFDLGLSGTARLHDLFVNIQGMTPGEFKNGGDKLHISYYFYQSPFGGLLVASTSKGICHMAFYEDQTKALVALKAEFPNATYGLKSVSLHQNALEFFNHKSDSLEKISLHLRATDFQLKVWEALLKIPFGGLSTYGKIANQIKNPKAARAVGTAIGSNPVAFLIPCHRVIQSTGVIGGYKWEPPRKTAIIGWEQANVAW